MYCIRYEMGSQFRVNVRMSVYCVQCELRRQFSVNVRVYCVRCELHRQFKVNVSVCSMQIGHAFLGKYEDALYSV